MSTLVATLATPALTTWGYTMSWGEAAGFATGLWCVVLAARKDILNFPVGILNSALLLVTFVDARLFADATLQVLFITLGVQGWWQWYRGGTPEEAAIRSVGPRGSAIAVAAAVALSAALVPVLTWARGSVPVFDATITGLSVVAQVLLNGRKVESWYLWVAVDLLSVPVYAYKGLYLIALLYVVFLGIACRGAWDWRKAAIARVAEVPA